MLAGTLGGVEMGLQAAGFCSGAVAAALAYLGGNYMVMSGVHEPQAFAKLLPLSVERGTRYGRHKLRMEECHD